LVEFDKSYQDVPVDWSVNKDEVSIQFGLKNGYEMLSYNLSNHSGEMVTLGNGLLYL